ncbi:hypothetical protein [Dongia sp.]|uniref:hypothetical protein n=1 Tax=Dongia sp. TaxID=1977262 RepID=UPI0035AF7AC8
MAESKMVREYRETLHKKGKDAAGKAAKLGLEIQEAESKRPGAGKTRPPGDYLGPGRVQATPEEDPRLLKKRR